MQKTLAPLALTTFALLALTVHPSQSVTENIEPARAAATVHTTGKYSRRTVSRFIRSGPVAIPAQTLEARPVAEAPQITTPQSKNSITSPFALTDHLKTVLDESPMEERHRAIAGTVLSLLPQDCQNRFETFSVLYDNPDHRGLAGRGVVILSGNVPDEEFVGLLLHEALGHYQELTCMDGDPSTGPSGFRDGDEIIYMGDPSAQFYAISWETEKMKRIGTNPEDFVTGYAQSDAFEDLAESVTYYISQIGSFEERAKTNPALASKLEWLKTHLPNRGGMYTGQPWGGTIAWDATKLVTTGER